MRPRLFLLPAIFFVSLFLSPVRASTPLRLPLVPDSLRALLRAAPAGAARVDALLRVARTGEVPLDSVRMLVYATTAERLARRLGDEVLLGRAIDMRGTYFLRAGDGRRALPLLRQAEVLLQSATPGVRTDNMSHLAGAYELLHRSSRALTYYRRAYALATERADHARRAHILRDIGGVYQMPGRFDSSAYYFYQAARLYHRLRNFHGEALTLNALGNVYYAQGRLPEATRYARQSYELIVQHRDSAQLAPSLSALGALAMANDSLNTAIGYFREELRLMRRTSSYGYLQNALNGLGVAHERLGHADSAAWYYRQAVATVEGTGNIDELGFALNNLARFYTKRRQWTEAVRYSRRTLALDHGREHPENTPDAWAILRRVAEGQGDYRQAYELLKRQQEVGERQQEQGSARLAEDLRIGYETEQAEQQVKLLQQDRELERLRRQRQVGGLIALAAVLLALIGGVVWWYRRRQTRHDDALRNRLAADLHDDVGSLLSQIAMQTDLLHEGVLPLDLQPAQLAEVADSSRMAVRQLNDVVWSLDAHNDTLPGLLARLRDYTHEVLHPTGRPVQFRAHDLPDAALPAPVRRHFYLIYKEALHNILKYAPPGALVIISLQRTADQLELTVENEGPQLGFNASEVAAPALSKGRESGHGLRNIRERAAVLGGQATAGPRPEGGFVVRVSVPLR